MNFLSILRRGACFAALLALSSSPAPADPIRHPTAVFAGLDKTTGRIINFDVAIDETVQFGTLQVTPRVCNTRPQTEAPQTTTFVEIDDQPLKENPRPGRPEIKSDPRAETRRVFSGWMFAASPGLHGVEHPVYDVWLVDCKGGKEVAATPAEPAPAPAAEAAPAPEPKKKRARKVEPAAPAPVENQPIGPADQPPALQQGEAPAAQPGVDGAPQGAPPPAKPKKKKKPKPPADQPQPGAEPMPMFQ